MSFLLIDTLSGSKATQITQVRPLGGTTLSYTCHRAYCSTDHKNHKDHSHAACLQTTALCSVKNGQWVNPTATVCVVRVSEQLAMPALVDICTSEAELHLSPISPQLVNCGWCKNCSQSQERKTMNAGFSNTNTCFQTLTVLRSGKEGYRFQ